VAVGEKDEAANGVVCSSGVLEFRTLPEALGFAVAVFIL
jgi:hypothetical protein